MEQDLQVTSVDLGISPGNQREGLPRQHLLQ